MTPPRPKILLLHLSPSGQFQFFAKWLAQNGWDVRMAHRGDDGPTTIDGLRVHSFRTRATDHKEGDFRYPLDYAAQNALGAAELFLHLREQDAYHPDIVMAHVGWGIGLCVKQIWPHTRYIAYHEWFYTEQDWSKGGKTERPVNLSTLVSNRMKNLPITAEFDSADANWCPTRFQAGRFPPALRPLLRVVPDGVDCDLHCPDSTAQVAFDWLALPDQPKILTYCTRGLEPLRGFPQFMKAVEEVQRRRSDFHTLVLAQDSVSYGPKLPAGDSWRLRMTDALDLDHRRLHFIPTRPRADYVRVLQASTAHVYFSEPFVTSWSLSEALAAGCLVIGSNTPPVMEMVEDTQTGILVDMDDPEEVADMIEWSFDHPQEAAQMRRRARQNMLERYATEHIFPLKAGLLRQLIDERAPNDVPGRPEVSHIPQDRPVHRTRGTRHSSGLATPSDLRSPDPALPFDHWPI